MLKNIFLSLLLILPNLILAAEPEYLQPGWTGQYKYGIGYSTNYASGPGTLILDYYATPDISYTGYFGLLKPAGDSQKVLNNNGSTLTESYSGAKSNATLSIAASYNLRVFRNDWTNIRVGALLGISYSPSVTYKTGTRVTILSTGAETDTNYGTIEKTKSPQIFAGPIVSTAFNIRWLPMITVGMDGGLMIYTASKTKTTTTASTTGASGNTGIDTETDTGTSAYTFGNGTFSLLGNFSIRYVW